MLTSGLNRTQLPGRRRARQRRRRVRPEDAAAAESGFGPLPRVSPTPTQVPTAAPTRCASRASAGSSTSPVTVRERFTARVEFPVFNNTGTSATALSSTSARWRCQAAGYSTQGDVLIASVVPPGQHAHGHHPRLPLRSGHALLRQVRRGWPGAAVQKGPPCCSHGSQLARPTAPQGPACDPVPLARRSISSRPSAGRQLSLRPWAAAAPRWTATRPPPACRTLSAPSRAAATHDRSRLCTTEDASSGPLRLSVLHCARVSRTRRSHGRAARATTFTVTGRSRLNDR